MVTSLVAGCTRMRIIDCVRTWSEVNFESSSEPRSRTVKAPCCPTALGEGDGEKRMPAADGEGIWTVCAVELKATRAAGIKYAKPPATAETAMASTARVSMVRGLRRPRDLRARCPGLIPSGKGKDCTRRSGSAL